MATPKKLSVNDSGAGFGYVITGQARFVEQPDFSSPEQVKGAWESTKLERQAEEREFRSRRAKKRFRLVAKNV